MHTSDDKTLEMNTRLEIRNTPIDVTEENPRQSLYSKDDTDIDPYSWLGENDPRRHMTDKETFERIMDLSEACGTEKQNKLCIKFSIKMQKYFLT